MSSPSEFVRRTEVIADGLATPFAGNDFQRRTFGGGIYRPDGTKVAHADRRGAEHFLFRQENPDRIDPAEMAAATRLPGRTLYLGNYIAQFGHFLAETLSTFWILEEQDPGSFDRIAFHPIGHGTGIPSYARTCLESFDIDPEKLVFLNEGPVRFDEVTVPARLVTLGIGASPTMAWVYGRIRERVLATGTPAGHRRVYLSRRRLKSSQKNRAVANEVRLEELFAAYGFTILYPERMGFSEQILSCGEAEVIAGMTGSALANSLFMPPGMTMIQINHPRLNPIFAEDLHYSQALSHRDVVVPFKGLSLINDLVVHFDTAHVEACLREALGPDAGTPKHSRRSLPYRVETAMEIFWRDVHAVGVTATAKVQNALRRAKRRGA